MVDHKNYDKNVDTLAKFGPSFQAKAVAAMLNSPDFLAQSYDVINPNFFEELTTTFTASNCRLLFQINFGS